MNNANQSAVWPSILKLEEVAALLGVVPSGAQTRIRERRMQPSPIAGKRFLRVDVSQYLSDPDRVARDWGRARRRAERADPTPIATGNVREPVVRLEDLPIILKIRDLAALLRV